MRRFRFSLRTLVCFALLCGSGVALWRNFDAWQIVAFLPLENESLRGLAISPDGKRIVTLSDAKLRIWDAATGSRQAVCPLAAQPDYIPSLAYSPDNKWILCTCRPQKADPVSGIFVGCLIEIWNAETGEKKTDIVTTEIASGTMRFSADGKRILNTSHLWEVDIETQKERWTIGLSAESFMGSFPPPTPEVEQKIRSAGTLQEIVELAKPFLIRCAVSADGRIATTNIFHAKYTQIWNLLDGKRIAEIPEGDWNNCLSSDGSILTTWNNDMLSFNQWNTKSEKQTIHFDYGGGPNDDSAERCLSPDGTRLLIAYANENVLRVWCAPELRLKWSASVSVISDTRFYASFFPDGERIVHQASGPVIHVRDAATGRFLAEISGKTDEENGTFGASPWLLAPDGSMIVAVYDDSHAAIWRRHRPEWWWGLAWLPEFWVTLVCAVAFGWSVRREFRAKYPSS